MRKLGDVTRTAQGLAIVRSPGDDYPNLGTAVVDEQLDDVGRVVDVFGPVERPYLAVSPADDVPLASLVGSRLYAR